MCQRIVGLSIDRVRERLAVVWRAREQERKIAVRIPRTQDDGVEAHAVAHRNHLVAAEEAGVRRTLACRHRGNRHENDDQHHRDSADARCAIRQEHAEIVITIAIAGRAAPAYPALRMSSVNPNAPVRSRAARV